MACMGSLFVLAPIAKPCRYVDKTVIHQLLREARFAKVFRTNTLLLSHQLAVLTVAMVCLFKERMIINHKM